MENYNNYKCVCRTLMPSPPPMTKSHNSCKTGSIAKSNLDGHLHVMLVTVYEQNPSRGVGGVSHTRLYVRTDSVRTEKCKS